MKLFRRDVSSTIKNWQSSDSILIEPKDNSDTLKYLCLAHKRFFPSLTQKGFFPFDDSYTMDSSLSKSN